MNDDVYWADREQTWKLTFRYGAIVEHIDLVHFNGGPLSAPAARTVADRWVATQGALRYVCPQCGVAKGLRCHRPKKAPQDPHQARVKLAFATRPA